MEQRTTFSVASIHRRTFDALISVYSPYALVPEPGRESSVWERRSLPSLHLIATRKKERESHGRED